MDIKPYFGAVGVGILIFLALWFAQQYEWIDWMPSPGPDGVEQAVIVQESSKPQTDIGKIEVLQMAHTIGVYVLDKDDVAADGETPDDMKPFIEAAKEFGLPSLVIKSGNKYKAQLLPDSFDKLKEIVQ